MAYEQGKIKGDGHVLVQDWEPIDSQGHHKKSSEIENDIDHTRSTMDILLDALSNRFQPRSMLDSFIDSFSSKDTQEKAKNSFLTIGNQISDAFQRNPLPMILMGTGAILMYLDQQNRNKIYYVQRSEASEKTKGSIEQAKEKIGGVVSNAREKISSGIEAAREKSEELRQRADETVEQYRQRMSSMREQNTQNVQRSTNAIGNFVRDNPLITGFASLVAGMVLGSLIPTSQVEKQTMGEAAEQGIESMKQKGEQAFDKGTESAKASLNPETNVQQPASDVRVDVKETPNITRQSEPPPSSPVE